MTQFRSDVLKRLHKFAADLRAERNRLPSYMPKSGLTRRIHILDDAIEEIELSRISKEKEAP